MVLEFSCSELNVEAKFIYSYRPVYLVLIFYHVIQDLCTAPQHFTNTMPGCIFGKSLMLTNNIYGAYNIIFNNYTTSPSFLRAGQVDYRS